MPSSIKAIFTADNTDVAKKLAQTEAMATGVGNKIAAGTRHSIGGLNMAMREVMVVGREIGRGNWARVPGSLSLIFQGLGASVMGLIVPLALLGLGIYGAVKHFMTLHEQLRNLRTLMSRSIPTFTEQAKAMKAASEEAQNFRDWLREVMHAQAGMAEKTEAALKALREQAKLEREIAKNRNASDGMLAQLDIEQARKELLLITTSKLSAARKLEQDILAAQTAESAAQSSIKGGNARMAALGTATQQAGAIVEAIKEKMKGGLKTVYTATGPAGLSANYVPLSRHDQIEIEVAGKKFKISLEVAERRAKELADEEAKLTAVQKQIHDILESKKKLVGKDKENYDKLVQMQDALQSDLNSKQSLLPLISGHGKMSAFSLNNQTSRGAYSATPPDFKRVVDAVVQIMHNTAHMKPPAQRPVGSQPPKFGSASHH